MMPLFQSYHVISGLIGIVLFLGSVLIWLSAMSNGVRRFTENLFIPERSLFDSCASYTGTVRFFQWAAWFLGACLFLPTFVGIDIGLAAAAFILWRYLTRQARSALVR
jgi:hypothetical protein